MTTPRKQQISLADTPYQQGIQRRIRRIFLCSEDKCSGKNYEHR